jgi:hypothetical protein
MNFEVSFLAWSSIACTSWAFVNSRFFVEMGRPEVDAIEIDVALLQLFA